MCHIYKMEDPLSCHFKNVLFKSQHIKYVKTLWVVSYPENNQWNGKVNLKKLLFPQTWDLSGQTNK